MTSNSDASDMRDNRMVELERLARRRKFWKVAGCEGGFNAGFEEGQKAALEASHHAELVAELKHASWLLADIDPDGLVKRQIDALLAKIGGDA